MPYADPEAQRTYIREYMRRRRAAEAKPPRPVLTPAERLQRKREAASRWYHQNKEKARAWQAANPDKMREYARRYYARHRDEILTKAKTKPYPKAPRSPEEKAIHVAKQQERDRANPLRHKYRSWVSRCQRFTHPHQRHNWDDFATAHARRPEHCESCGVPIQGRWAQLDHNHTTGRLRGWLCAPCNTLLGIRNEDPDQLPPHLIEYLARTDD